MRKERGLHIGLVGPLPPPFGGMANQMKQLIRLLQSEGIEVSIVQTNRDYWPKAIGRFRRIRALFRLVPYVVELWKLARQVDAIHVLANSGWSWQLFATPAVWIGHFHKTPVIVNYRGGEARKYFRHAIARVRPTMTKGNALIVPSPYLQKVFSEFDLRAEVIPNIVDLERFKPREDTEVKTCRGPCLVITRNLEPIYDIPTAIRAVALLKPDFPELRLFIAGSGPQEQELKAVSAELGLDKVITFTGRLSPDDIADLYRGADAMLNPTTVDNMPNSILEALASGLPVVTTNVGGIPYVVEDEVTALFIAPGDAKAMAKQVRRLLSDSDLYARLVSNGQRHVQQFAWEIVKDQWLTLYRRLGASAIKDWKPEPRLVVFSTLFPHSGAPNAGVFIRERMFRVGKQLRITVVSPKPWFPGQSLMRHLRPGLRPHAARQEIQYGTEVFFPRFFSFPFVLKQFDGLFLALGAYRTLRKLKKLKGFNLLDAHFAYPDGYAAVLLGKWLRVPVTITLRGTEVPHSRNPKLRPRLVQALKGADHMFSVSESLRQHAIELGADPEKIQVVGNGVDIEKFHPEDKTEARRRLSLPDNARILISVGALVERKGFHRVIELIPELLIHEPNLHYLIVGGPSPEGNMQEDLARQVANLGLDQHVHFLGSMPLDQIRWPLSAADVFVLATSNEGWANVFLEAMACGLPVITTDVGGNAEVVSKPELGTVVPFGRKQNLLEALQLGLDKNWDRGFILGYAEENRWDIRIKLLVNKFHSIIEDQITPHNSHAVGE